jgi:hypothetical protein
VEVQEREFKIAQKEVDRRPPFATDTAIRSGKSEVDSEIAHCPENASRMTCPLAKKRRIGYDKLPSGRVIESQ